MFLSLCRNIISDSDVFLWRTLCAAEWDGGLRCRHYAGDFFPYCIVTFSVVMFFVLCSCGARSGTEGYIAVIMPKDSDWMESVPTLTEEQYSQRLPLPVAGVNNWGKGGISVTD